jgi:hypothetical protein
VDRSIAFIYIRFCALPKDRQICADLCDTIRVRPIRAIWPVFNIIFVFFVPFQENRRTSPSINTTTFLARLSARWHAHPPYTPNPNQLGKSWLSRTVRSSPIGSHTPPGSYCAATRWLLFTNGFPRATIGTLISPVDLLVIYLTHYQ